jgi:hypothetical protein
MTKIAGSGSGSGLVKGAGPDPDPPQNVMDPQHCLYITLWCGSPAPGEPEGRRAIPGEEVPRVRRVPRPPPPRPLRHRGARGCRAPPAHARTVQRAAHAGWLPVLSSSVPDPGSFAFLTPGAGSGIRNRFIPDLGSRIPNPYFLELSDKFLC